ncbi:hypothetical protein MP228_008331 [Amoeboaphelidium protococcarum]|nr:hypothetical protein MP228_008331 [Amoeboaphelidium protococcarum]
MIAGRPADAEYAMEEFQQQGQYDHQAEASAKMDTIRSVSGRSHKHHTADAQKTQERSFTSMLLHFATRKDKILMVLGLIAAIAAGSVLPLMTIVFGALSDDLGKFQVQLISADQLQSSINGTILYFVYLAAATLVTTYVYIATFTYISEQVSSRLRKAYLEGVLKQDIAYFESVGAGQVSTRIITDTQLFQDGIGEKIPLLAMNLSTFVAAFIVAFTSNAKLTGVLFVIIPIMAVVMVFFRKYIVLYTKRSLDSYAKAGDVAEEALSAIRTVVAFMAHNKMVQRYNKLLLDAEVQGVKKQLAIGGVFALFQFIIYGAYSLAFYYGGTLLANGELTPGQILTCFFSVVIGAFAVAGSSGELQAIGFAAGAGITLFEPIDRNPVISTSSDSGKVLDKVVGRVDVQNVSFKYPTRPDSYAIKNMNLIIEPGTTVALVGQSGSGKSSLVGLIERFYDPVDGKIFLDGVDIKEMNVSFLRRNVGYVTQEPVLFKGTIVFNVAHGLIGSEHENASAEKKLELVMDACKQGNAHNFIMKLPNQYNTEIGERGLLLSGGQKQRIAIARAIIKKPKILLLDEATSALDTASERIVQDALERVSQDCTTIVIAHRLSTVKNADMIVVMSKGDVIETGTHKSLTEIPNGYYRQLVQMQQVTANKDQKAIENQQNPDEVIIAQQSQQKDASLEKLTVEQVQDSKAAAHYSSYRVFYEISKLNLPEWKFSLLGLVGSTLSGATQPLFALIFGNILLVFYERGAKLRQDADFWALMFFIVAVASMIANFLKFYYFGLAGEKLTTRLRDLSFKAMLQQEIGWFDQEQNSVGALTSNLSSGAQQVQNMSGTILGSFVELGVTFLGTAIIALVTQWKLGLVTFACLPLLVLANKMRVDMLRKGNEATKEYYEKSAQVACEAVAAMKTIASLTREKDVMRMYSKELETPLSIGVHHAIYGSFWYAVSQSLNFLVNALAFWYGTRLFIFEGLDIKQMFIVLMSVIFAAQASGRVFSMMPNLTTALLYAKDILSLLARRTKIDSFAAGEKLDRDRIQGNITFKDVQFEYPTRPGLQVLRGLNFSAATGLTAICGPSGSGKSTVVGLIERFYDYQQGRVMLDDHEIKNVDLKDMRRIVSIVSQEPSLFNVTIRDNICLGVAEAEMVTDEQIMEAAKKSNIHDFIMSMPDGYLTMVGGKGGSLSGGQKQRIAIARSLVLNPKVLLLDEATSALDSESEKIVQDALDKASEGRTTIAIAHRLSSIKHANSIIVLQDGKVVESGTHEQLISQNGVYNDLVAQQDLNTN